MTLTLIGVGRPRDRTLARAHDAYAQRLARLRVRYEAVYVPDVPARTASAGPQALAREAEHLRRRLGPRARYVLLDRRGELWSSPELARRLERWASEETAFVIGGPLGLHSSLFDAATAVWSLSPLTFPHELARVLVVEQLYRAVTILRGIPYHR